MNRWYEQTQIYLPKLHAIHKKFEHFPPMPQNIPKKEPLDTEIHILLHKAVRIYNIGFLQRSNETFCAIIHLWKEGYLAQCAALIRILFEIWGLAYYQTKALKRYSTHNSFKNLLKTIENVQGEIYIKSITPWGSSHIDDPIHIMDTLKMLHENEYPEVLTVYDDLCASVHANLARYLEWNALGKQGDQWHDETIFKAGHERLTQTVESLEVCMDGIQRTIKEGLKLCEILYDEG